MTKYICQVNFDEMIFCKLNTPVSNKDFEGFSSKPSGVDFDAVTDKPSKQEPECFRIMTD